MTLRTYRLDEAREAVVRAARFRAPQRRAFERVHELVRDLEADLPDLSRARLVEQLQQDGLHVPGSAPYMVFHLATGVGKTRLMGAVLTYLYRSGQTRNVLILAPRTTVVDRLERLCNPSAAQYLFLDSNLVPEPNLCFRGNVETFVPREDSFNVFVLSPQSISGGDRRFGRPREFSGGSLQEYLQATDDLIVFTDEAHHLGTDDEAAWTTAIDSLAPRVHFGLTATPKAGPGINVLYSYDLTTCLQQGLYTKAVNVLVRPRDEAMDDDEWDRHTIDYALRRLERKRAALQLFAERHDDFPFVEPVALLCARDIDHAEEIARWLTERRDFDPSELLVTHSQRAQTEAEIARLIAIDQPGNTIRVVINVYQLTEGWDVTNVYVIAPLRAMATFQGAIQTMGRGLRLPAGHRVDDPDIDKLDVLCFGRETLEAIVRNATDTFGVERETGPPVDVATPEEQDGQEPAIPRDVLLIRCERSVAVPVPIVRRILGAVPLDFDIGEAAALSGGSATAIDLASLQASGIDERVAYDLDDVVRVAAARVIARLRYMSDFTHGPDVEALLRRFLVSIGATATAPLFVDPVKLSLHVAEEIDRRYRARGSRFEAGEGATTIHTEDVVWPVPQGFTAPMGRVPVQDWNRSLHFRIPIDGWRKCCHAAAAFEGRGEYAAAGVLDSTAVVEWWFRNDPVKVRIPTPVGNFEPDFVYLATRNGEAVHGLLEIKGAIFWDGEGSDPRVKSEAATRWVAAVNAAASSHGTWEFAIVLDTDAVPAGSLEELRRIALVGAP